MQKKWLTYGLWAMVAVAVLTAAHIAFWQRYCVEQDYRQVELALGYDEISSSAGTEGLTVVQGLKEFKKHGVTGVVIREPMLDDLRQNGDIEVFSGQELLKRQGKDFISKHPLNRNHTYIMTSSKDVFDQLSSQMSAKLANVEFFETGQDTYVIETLAPYTAIKELGVGFTRKSVEDVRQAEMNGILQIRTWPGPTQQNIDKVFKLYRNIPNVSAVLFNDDTLPGYPSLLPVLAEEVRKMDVPLVQVEFFPQRGFEKLGILLDKKVVRLHTIAQNELKRVSAGEALDRYTLAAAERNHRILLVRPFLTGGDLMQENLNFMDQLKSRLEKEGLQVGSFSLLPPVPVSGFLVLLIGLGVIAGGLLLLDRLSLGRWIPIIGLGALILWPALMYLDFVQARKLMALASVIIFPTLALLWNLKREGQAPGQAVVSLFRISLFSLLGALFTVGLLADAGFMLKLDQFSGVKLAHVVPLMIVLFYLSLDRAKGEGLVEKIKGMLDHPVKLGVALAAGFMAVAVAIYVMRTGNEGMTVSGAELQFRSLLDQLLGVRPRTKEFLLGHPALLLLLLYGYKDNRFLPLLLLAAIGQASLVNTFAHIHTPLWVSMLRAFNGLWLGILLGLAVYWSVQWAVRRGRDRMHG
ncbi:DUF5693 family protein [Desulforamulus ruminis]|uniref:DUF5693 family protein n=1 Tax=Desulforamulus ruminis TaxID=1564 RepID=UPI002FD8863E